jgi:glycosyltransferase involved in cell wall biosynthesis
MYSPQQSKADLHVHSKHSDRPSEWFLRRIGAPECFVEPLEIYQCARRRGMDFVTITDHNCIRGAEEIAHLPGRFISNETTTYFPEDGCKVHILVFGISDDEFRMIQELRADIYQLRRYLLAEDILYSVSHPLYRVNGRLTVSHVEKLLLMFSRFEAINGVRDRRSSELVDVVFRHLTPELMAKMADRHGIEPDGPEPWKKTFTGGSDDHSGVYAGIAHTVTPPAEDVTEFLAHLKRGDHEAAGCCGGSVMMGHSFYHIAYGYYKDRFLRGDGSGKPTIIGELFKKLLQSPAASSPTGGFRGKVRTLASGLFWSRQVGKLSDVERMLVEEFSRLFSTENPRDVASLPMDDRRTFRIACQISHTLGYGFLRRFVEFAEQGRLMESLQTVASLGPVALSMAPYLAAFSTQHKDEPFLQAVAAHFSAAADVRSIGPRKAWVTDTFADVNGVSRTIQSLAAVARQTGRQLTVVTSLSTLPPTKADVKNFPPVGTFQLPEYRSQTVSFPPFLEVIEYIERQRFNEVIISTPGTMGLTALLAARLLGLRTAGIYHTDFPEYVRYLTEDDDLADMTWKYMRWFYEQCDTIFVPTESYRKHLICHEFEPVKIKVMARGVDTQLFHPGKRDPAFYDRYGLSNSFKFLFVGRLSREKNLNLLVDAFDRVLQAGRQASLIFVGDGPYREELQLQCAGRPIVFTGFLAGEELATAYASGDAMVFPSATDTFGNVVLEAQASGLPVIVADRGGPPDIVRRHNSGIIFDVARLESLVDAMAEICSNPQLCGELRARGLGNAQECGWHRVLEDLWGQSDEVAHEEMPIDHAFEPQLTPGVISLELA